MNIVLTQPFKVWQLASFKCSYSFALKYSDVKATWTPIHDGVLQQHKKIARRLLMSFRQRI